MNCKRILYCACLVVLAAPSVGQAQTIDPANAKASADGQVLWYDCKDIGVEGKGWNDTASLYERLPARAQGKVSSYLWTKSRHSAGLRVRFASDATVIHVRWTVTGEEIGMRHMPATGVSGVDLYAKDKTGRWRFVQNGRATGLSNTASFQPPPAEQYLLYLPLYNNTQSVEVGIPQGRTLATADAMAAGRKKPIAFYGTSITQGACASRPGMAYSAILGRRLNVPFINLGFDGSGKMEPEMAELLAELDPSIYVIDCLWNMTPDMVSQRVEPFVKILRTARPTTPIVLVEDSSFMNVCPTEKGRILRKIYHKLTANGVKNLHFLSNQNMLGVDGEATVDGCHPSDLGMMRYADAYVGPLSKLLGQK